LRYFTLKRKKLIYILIMDENNDEYQQEDKKECDKSLWQSVTKDVTPLNAQKYSSTKENKEPRHTTREVAKETIIQPHSKSNEVDHQTARRLKRGKIPIEGRLDLHGMTQTQAFDALQRLIPMAYGQRKRCILVITGKGTRRSSNEEFKTGILKQKVPEWLNEPPLGQFVLKLQTAQIKDGGEGALYVYLRRQRD